MRRGPWVVLLSCLQASLQGLSKNLQCNADTEDLEGCSGHELVQKTGKTVCKSGEGFAFTTSRVVVVADVHGDWDRLKDALKMASLIDDKANWVGGTAVLVQTGDILDRGPDSLNIFMYLERLGKEAVNAGGCLIQILGNHETLNLAGDFRYADSTETVRFGGSEQRRKSLSPGQWLGDLLRNLPLVAKVVQQLHDGSNHTSIMSHAGVEPWLAEEYGIEGLNSFIRESLQGASEREIQRLSYTHKIMLGKGPMWTRVFADQDESRVCSILDQSLQALKSHRMIVGHTVQESGRPTVRCKGKLILADTGMSKVYGGGYSAVELNPMGKDTIILYT